MVKYFPRRRNRPAVVTQECGERGSHPVLYWKLLDNLFLNYFHHKLFFAKDKDILRHHSFGEEERLLCCDYSFPLCDTFNFQIVGQWTCSKQK